MAGLKEWFKQDWVDIGSKKAGSGEKMRKKNAKGAPKSKDFKRAKQTARA